MSRTVVWLSLALVAAGCHPDRYAARRFGRTLLENDYVFAGEADADLAGEALPFALKLNETLLAEAPRNRDLLLSACRASTLYAWGWVDAEAEAAMETDVRRAERLHARAEALYLRGLGYCLRGLERSYPGFRAELGREPSGAVARIESRHLERDLPFLYWSAASLYLATAASGGASATLLARLPEAEAMLDRALVLDESWRAGALHELSLRRLAAALGPLDEEASERHFRRGLELAGASGASLHVAWAETTCVARQDREGFVDHLRRALAVSPETAPDDRLRIVLAQRRAQRLLDRVDEWILDLEQRDGNGRPG